MSSGSKEMLRRKFTHFSDQGKSFVSKGQFKDAINCYETALSCGPALSPLEAVKTLSNLSFCHERSGSVHLAVSSALEAVKICSEAEGDIAPHFPIAKAYYRLGAAFEAQGNAGGALSAFGVMTYHNSQRGDPLEPEVIRRVERIISGMGIEEIIEIFLRFIFEPEGEGRPAVDGDAVPPCLRPAVEAGLEELLRQEPVSARGLANALSLASESLRARLVRWNVMGRLGPELVLTALTAALAALDRSEDSAPILLPPAIKALQTALSKARSPVRSALISALYDLAGRVLLQGPRDRVLQRSPLARLFLEAAVELEQGEGRRTKAALDKATQISQQLYLLEGGASGSAETPPGRETLDWIRRSPGIAAVLYGRGEKSLLVRGLFGEGGSGGLVDADIVVMTSEDRVGRITMPVREEIRNQIAKSLGLPPNSLSYESCSLGAYNRVEIKFSSQVPKSLDLPRTNQFSVETRSSPSSGRGPSPSSSSVVPEGDPPCITCAWSAAVRASPAKAARPSLSLPQFLERVSEHFAQMQPQPLELEPIVLTAASSAASSSSSTAPAPAEQLALEPAGAPSEPGPSTSTPPPLPAPSTSTPPAPLAPARQLKLKDSIVELKRRGWRFVDSRGRSVDGPQNKKAGAFAMSRAFFLESQRTGEPLWVEQSVPSDSLEDIKQLVRWAQTGGSLIIRIPLGRKVDRKDVTVDLGLRVLEVTCGSTLILKGCLLQAVNFTEATWTLEDGGSVVELTAPKFNLGLHENPRDLSPCFWPKLFESDKYELPLEVMDKDFTDLPERVLALHIAKSKGEPSSSHLG